MSKRLKKPRQQRLELFAKKYLVFERNIEKEFKRCLGIKTVNNEEGD